MNKTLVALTSCLMLLGAVAVSPTAEADHLPDVAPDDNPCIETQDHGRICVVSDDAWCWMWHHCPW